MEYLYLNDSVQFYVFHLSVHLHEIKEFLINDLLYRNLIGNRIDIFNIWSWWGVPSIFIVFPIILKIPGGAMMNINIL